MQVLIRQAKVIDPGSEYHNKVVDITITGGTIARIAVSARKTGGSTIEAEGKVVYQSAKGEDVLCISPGWVDIFADYAEPGYEHKETIASGLKVAAAGGFTDVFITPNTQPAISTKSVVEFVQKRASGSIVNLHPLGSVSQQVEGKALAEMMDMQAHGAIAFTDGWKPVQNAGLMLKALEYIKAFNGVLIQVPDDTSISSGGLMHEGNASTRLGMPGIPAEAETIMLNRDLQLLRYTGSKLHCTGISTAGAVDMIRKAKKDKLNITCSVTPYHLALTDEALSGYDSAYKVNPPLRSEKDRQALIKGLADGTIDCIASHHHPQDWDAKTKEFEYAANGMAVQQYMYNIALNAVAGKVETGRLVEALSAAPRSIFRLADATVKKGNTAALTLFTQSSETPAMDSLSQSANNPFGTTQYAGSVKGIINNNKISLNK